MTTLIIKSKIWNKSNSPLINYKDKSYLKQKITIERSGIISRRKDKIVFKQTEDLNNSNNSSENTNYMNEPRTSELISIEKRPNESNFYINCGDWPKDLLQLMDQNAVYFLYKGLTIENFLKEKQKYYVLNQGDIIKLGKIYLKILHIKLTGSNKKEDEDEDEKDKANKTTDKEHSDKKKKLVSDSESSDEDDSESNSENEDNESERKIKDEIKEEEDEDKKSESIKKNNSQYDSNSYENNKKKDNESNLIENSEDFSNNISNKRKNKKNNNIKDNNRLNRSFNGNLYDNCLDKIIKENRNINRSMSFTLKKKKNKNISINICINNNLNLSPKKRNKKNKTKEKNKNKDDIQNNKKKEKVIKEKDKEKESLKPQEKKEKGKICRICLSGEDNPVKNPLICPCTCKGSMKFIHYFCLKNWLNLKIESDLGYGRDIEIEQPTITYSTKDIACELCKTKLPDYIKHKGKIYNVSFYKPKYNKFIVLESIRDDNRRTKFIHIIPLNRRQIIKIGRLNNCDLSLPDFSISRVHCCMYIESGQLFLENNSKFGTKILVQTQKLTMSLQYPLSIEVQKTYLKLRLQKPFSLFSCCNVYTTSMTKMLVYQKQNERGFDLFCSMVFKEDDNEMEEDEEKNSNNINNNEDLKNNENNKDGIDKQDKNNNKDEEEQNNNKAKNKNNQFIKESEYNKNIILENKTKEIIKNIELNKKECKNKKEILIEKELINKNQNDNKNAENIDDKKKELIDYKEAHVKDKFNIKIDLISIEDNKVKEKKNDIKKEEYKKIIMENKNANIQEKQKKGNEDINYNNNKNENQRKIERVDNIKTVTNSLNKENNKLFLSKSKTIQNNEENEDIKNLIDSDFKMNGRRANLQKKEDKNKQNLIDIEFKNFEKKIMKKEKEELPKKIKEEKNEDDENLFKKQYSIRKKEDFKKINELNRKETINLENEINKNEKIYKKDKNKINNLETEEPKTIIENEKQLINEEEKKKEQKIINTDKNEYTKEIKQEKIDKDKKIEINLESEEIKHNSKENIEKKTEKNNTIHSESFRYETKRPKKPIDLNAINDLSYKQGQDLLKNKNSAFDNYQSIFGLMPSKQNETSFLLAPKHTKKDSKHFDLNIKNQEINYANKSKVSWNKYTSKYEENKHKKDT